MIKIGNFGKNVAMLTGGTAFAQILSFVLIPVITRIYPPDQYGILTIYVSILGLLGLLGSLNYELAIPIAESDKKAINVLVFSFIILIVSFSLLSILLFFFGNQFLIIFNSSTLIDYQYLIPIGFLLIGLYNILTQWLLRRKIYKVITVTKFSQAVLQNISTISLGISGFGTTGLLVGKIIGQSGGLSTLVKPLIKEDKKLFNKVKTRNLVWVAKRYRNFPLYTTPRRYLGDLTIVLPVIFITSLYGPHAVGLFGLANSVIQLPMSLIGNSVSNVFYAESASLKAENPAKLKELSNKLLKFLLMVGIVPLLVLIFFGPLLFSLVFGSEWDQAGTYASLLSISVFSRLVFKPISNIFDIFEKQKMALLLNVFRLILVLIVFFTSNYLKLNSFWAVGLYSISMAIVYFIQYLLAQKIINEAVKNFGN